LPTFRKTGRIWPVNDPGKSHETHIPAQQNQARTNPRFSCSYGHKSRATRSEAPPRKRPRAADAVKKHGRHDDESKFKPDEQQSLPIPESESLA